MAYTTWSIKREKRIDDFVWSGELTPVTQFNSPLVRTSLGDGKDTFSFKMTNHNGELNDYWKSGDKVYIYRAVNTSTITSNDLLMLGIVTSAPEEINGKRDSITISGANYSESITNALVFVPIPSGGYDIAQFLEACVNSVAFHNTNFSVTWDSTNPTTQSDGSSFPSVTENWFYKSITQALEEYSKADVTEDGNYYWYVSTANTLVWHKKTDEVDYDFDVSTDLNKGYSIKKDISEVKNFVIAKGGHSPGGSAITYVYDDPVSRARHGFKYYILVSKANSVTAVLDKDLGDDRTSSFPSSYPHTPYWGGGSVSSPSEYDAAVRLYVKTQLQQEAKAFLEERKFGKLIIEVKFAPGKGWSIGNVVNVTMPAIGKSNDPMRVKEAEYGNTYDRFWLEEDEGTI